MPTKNIHLPGCGANAMDHAAREHRAQQAENDFGEEPGLESVAQHDRFKIGYGLCV